MDGGKPTGDTEAEGEGQRESSTGKGISGKTGVFSMKTRAVGEFCGTTVKRWYLVFEDGNVSVTWSETGDEARTKVETRILKVKEVFAAPSALDEVRPLKENLEKNVAKAAKDYLRKHGYSR